MSTDYQRPEGQLLADAIKAKGFSIRQVAKAMDISDTRLRHIINGYQPVKGDQALKVVGPADTIARAARVVDLTPESLEDAGRPDAADALRRHLRITQLGELIPKRPASDAEATTTAAILRRLDAIDRRLNDLEDRVPPARPNLAGVAFEDERETHTDFD